MKYFIYLLVIFFPTYLISQRQHFISIDYGVKVGSINHYFDNKGDFYNDAGLHLIDGLFIKANKKKFAYRFLANYRSPNFFILPKYEVESNSLHYSKIKVLDVSIGIQYVPLNKKCIYVFGDAIYSTRYKEGLMKNYVATFYNVLVRRKEFGIDAGLGYKQNIGKALAISLEGKLYFFRQNSNIVLIDFYTMEEERTSLNLFRLASTVQLMLTFNIH